MKLYIWRHPKPVAANGICLGQTDMGVNPRKIKRLANKIERFVRKHRLPKVLWVSPLQRSVKVGELLAQRGFEYHVDADLSELDFGAWDGLTWEQIGKPQIDAWCDNFANFDFETGESVQQLFLRVEHWLNAKSLKNGNQPILAVGHAGWINAARMLADGQSAPKNVTDWPRPVVYRKLSIIEITTQ